MGSALGRGDDVNERARGGVVPRSPPHRDVDLAHTLDFGGDHRSARLQHGNSLGERARAGKPPCVGDRGVGGEEFGELRDAAVEAVARLDGFVAALVGDDDLEAGNEERRLTGALHELVEAEGRVFREDLPIGPVADACAGDPAGRLAHDAQLAAALERGEGRVGTVAGEEAGLAPVERHRVGLARAVDLDVQALGQGVDHRGAHAVQTARGGVRTTAELAAGVELGEHDFDAGQARSGLDIDRDATGPVANLDAAVAVQHDVDAGAVAGEGLVDGVVDDLPQAVHEPPGVGGADVHARALAHRFEALEDLEMMGEILGRHNLPA